jgi:DNA-binding transcriptional regulator YiaG
MGVLTARRGLSLVGMSQSAERREPNETLRAIRQSLLMSQGEFALAIRAAGQRAGEPNDCTKRLVQRWESGYVTSTPRGNYARALEAVTGQPIENLGFEPARRQVLGAAGVAVAGAAAAAWAIPEARAKGARGPLTGIWRSSYDYVSSSRGGETYTGQHYVVVIQHGDRLQVRSLPHTAQGRVMMDLTASGSVLTGTWQEITDAAGYYKGSTYHGAIQLTAGPSGTRLTGAWVGFGKDGEINTGPWTLDLVSADTSKAAMEKYNRPVAGES